jgi:hypothetical protein
MKRLLILTLLFLGVCASANAQKWDISYEKGNPVKNTEDHVVNQFGLGLYFRCRSNSSNLTIGCSYGIFHPKNNFNQHVDVTIGLYEGDTLVEKIKAVFWLGDTLDVAFSFRKQLNKRIIEHLKTKGDVRIYAPKYRGDNYDLRLPMNPEIRYNEKKK